MFEGIMGVAMLFQKFTVDVAEDFDWSTVFTGFGLRPFDFNTARVCMRLTVKNREDLV